MASISATPGISALSVLQAPGAPLSGVSTIIPQSVLDGASPQDWAVISKEASSLSQVEGLYAGWTTSQPNAGWTPTQPQLLNLQMLDSLYGVSTNPPASSTPGLNVLG